MATLVYSSIGRDRSSILSLTNDFKSINKLMNCIFHLKSSERVIISNNRYYYAPSDEYKKYMKPIWEKVFDLPKKYPQYFHKKYSEIETSEEKIFNVVIQMDNRISELIKKVLAQTDYTEEKAAAKLQEFQS